MAIAIRPILVALLTAAAVACLPEPGHAQFALYDNFASGIIDPGLWQGHLTDGSFSAPTAEAILAVENSALRVKLVSWGNDTSDSGSVGSNEGLQFRQLGTSGGSGSIIGIKFKVTVLDAVVEDCPANPGTGGSIRARAGFYAWWFNDGTSPGAGDATGNIYAGLQLTKEGDQSNQIQPFVLRCTNAACTTFVTPAGVTAPTMTSTWTLNTPLIVKVRWDRVNGKFKFLVIDQTTQVSESVVVDYLGLVNDPGGGPANFDFKRILVSNTAKNCSTGRKKVVMDALFDNINVQRAP